MYIYIRTIRLVFTGNIFGSILAMPLNTVTVESGLIAPLFSSHLIYNGPSSALPTWGAR